MEKLSLRLRVFLFFGLLVAGGIVAVTSGLFLGYSQLGNPDALSSFISAGIVSVMLSTGLTVAIWLLFDENVSKPIEALAAGLRVRTHSDVVADIDTATARYLGDLAPAVQAIHKKLESEAHTAARSTADRTARLEAHRSQLLQILSDIPVAVIVAGQDHKIALYDGQAAELMERESPARLSGSVCDYLEEKEVEQALTTLKTEQAPRCEISIKGRSGTLYKGHMRLFGEDAGYTLMLEPLTPDASRPLVYDFDLLEKEPAGDLANCTLRDLSFVVFDSETTGLDRDADDVVQLGAVRVVNGKIVPGEVFDMLVNPQRPIPPGSTRVHHVDDAMVADAPTFDIVCRKFHQFADTDIIVAHNAPFDMAFLRRQSKGMGISFNNSVLDTVHLSAVVFGGSEEHTLDALCARLKINIPHELRHTALGDAIATAEALVGMLPILEARGLRTFGLLRQEVQKHKRILTVDA